MAEHRALDVVDSGHTFVVVVVRSSQASWKLDGRPVGARRGSIDNVPQARVRRRRRSCLINEIQANRPRYDSHGSVAGPSEPARPQPQPARRLAAVILGGTLAGVEARFMKNN